MPPAPVPSARSWRHVRRSPQATIAGSTIRCARRIGSPARRTGSSRATAHTISRTRRARRSTRRRTGSPPASSTSKPRHPQSGPELQALFSCSAATPRREPATAAGHASNPSSWCPPSKPTQPSCRDKPRTPQDHPTGKATTERTPPTRNAHRRGYARSSNGHARTTPNGPSSPQAHPHRHPGQANPDTRQPPPTASNRNAGSSPPASAHARSSHPTHAQHTAPAQCQPACTPPNDDDQSPHETGARRAPHGRGLPQAPAAGPAP